MGTIARWTSKGQLFPVNFGQLAVPISQTAVQLAMSGGGSGNTGFVVPFAGHIIAMSWELSAALTAGVDTLTLSIGGVAQAASVLTLPIGPTSGYGRIKRGRLPIKAGDVLGVQITTSAGHLPTTTNLVCHLYYLGELEGV